MWLCKPSKSSRKHSNGFWGRAAIEACKRDTSATYLLIPVLLVLGNPSPGAGIPTYLALTPVSPRSRVCPCPFTLITALSTGTVTHIPPASTQLMCLKPQEA